MPMFFTQGRESINISRAVRVVEQEAGVTMHWVDENNSPKALGLRSDEWQEIRRDLGV